MTKTYLIINAVLYALFVLWCTFGKAHTARASGYETLSRDGWVEYLVIYGGLQLGLAAFYAYTAFNPQYHRIALMFSLFIYSTIVIYRLGAMMVYWPVGKVTMAVAALEVALLIGAIVVFIKSGDAAIMLSR
jgi:hypothetical protein